jgi:hypothetical protein
MERKVRCHRVHVEIGAGLRDIALGPAFRMHLRRCHSGSASGRLVLNERNCLISSFEGLALG